mmetsp:Transcript_7447/g.14566  ORF Transcript_7447/g.14566 Transcript_7447/m.14566 type:complete len:240 (+) Transcript_7447:45-764(+)
MVTSACACYAVSTSAMKKPTKMAAYALAATFISASSPSTLQKLNLLYCVEFLHQGLEVTGALRIHFRLSLVRGLLLLRARSDLPPLHIHVCLTLLLALGVLHDRVLREEALRFFDVVQQLLNAFLSPLDLVALGIYECLPCLVRPHEVGKVREVDEQVSDVRQVLVVGGLWGVRGGVGGAKVRIELRVDLCYDRAGLGRLPRERSEELDVLLEGFLVQPAHFRGVIYPPSVFVLFVELR